MRLFVAALATETNAFSPLPGTMRGFEAGVLFHGDATRHPLTLFTEPLHVWRACAESDGVEMIESVAAMAQPSGPVSRYAYETLRDEILGDLRGAGPLDLVLLMLHGAMAAQDYPDCEGDIVARIRAITGREARIGVLLDLHASVSAELLAQADIVTCCHLYPHTDFGVRARRLYGVIRAARLGRVAPVTAFSRVDMLGFYPTSAPGMRELVDRMRVLEEQQAILAVALVHGFPWSDSVDTGAGVIAVTHANAELARRTAVSLAGEFAQARHAAPRLLTIEEALDQAFRSDDPPVVIADACDNPGGGAPGDSTFLLEALLNRNAGNAALALLWDPFAVQIAADAGEGARLSIRIGGKTAPTSGRPLDVQATVVRVLETPRQRGLDGKSSDALGRSVLLQMERVQVVLNSLRQQVFDPACFTQFGVRLEDQRVLVVKSSQHFAAQFERVSRSFFYCQTPGCLAMNFSALPYRYLRRPMWPLDRSEPAITTELSAPQRQ